MLYLNSAEDFKPASIYNYVLDDREQLVETTWANVHRDRSVDSLGVASQSYS
jgi:hypothetical protein